MSQRILSDQLGFETLYPDLPRDEREAAQERFDRYLELVLRIYERLSGERATSGQPETLTAAEQDARINGTDATLSQ